MLLFCLRKIFRAVNVNAESDGRSPFSHLSHPKPNLNSYYRNLTLTLNLTPTKP